MVKEVDINKPIHMYECEVCNEQYLIIDDARKCENSHSKKEKKELAQRKQIEYLMACAKCQAWMEGRDGESLSEFDRELSRSGLLK